MKLAPSIVFVEKLSTSSQDVTRLKWRKSPALVRLHHEMQPALPPPNELVSSIRTSCAALCQTSSISINEDAIRSFLSTIEQQDWQACHSADSHGIRLPLRFDSELEELDILCTLSLLNFLSGYRKPLKRLTGRGAWDNVLALVLASHLSATDEQKSNVPLSTKGTLTTSVDKLAQLMNIKTHTEKDHPTLGSAVKVGERDLEAMEILELLERALKETGEALKLSNKKSLGEWVRDALIETNADVGTMLDKLVNTFPPFRDVHIVDGQPCIVLKKALFLLSVITLTFSAPGRQKPSFPLPDITKLPIFADNVIPTMLLHYGIIDTSTATDSTLRPEQLAQSKLLSTDSAYRIRAAAVTACHRIVMLVQQDSSLIRDGREWLRDMKETDLDAYLWNVGKKGALRDSERFAEKRTYMY
ncbi:hypothetical protein ACM66B_004699 [Microbotryomycetes sp. NB124-2]